MDDPFAAPDTLTHCKKLHSPTERWSTSQSSSSRAVSPKAVAHPIGSSLSLREWNASLYASSRRSLPGSRQGEMREEPDLATHVTGVEGPWPPKKPFWKTVVVEGGKPPPRVSVGLPRIGLIKFQGRSLGSVFLLTGLVTGPPEANTAITNCFHNAAPRGHVLDFELGIWICSRCIYHVRFNGQDTRMVQLMRTPPERLYRPDLSIVAWRRMCEKALSNSTGPGSSLRRTPPKKNACRIIGRGEIL